MREMSLYVGYIVIKCLCHRKADDWFVPVT